MYVMMAMLKFQRCCVQILVANMYPAKVQKRCAFCRFPPASENDEVATMRRLQREGGKEGGQKHAHTETGPREKKKLTWMLDPMSLDRE
jgi:hypothetical protein